MKGILERAGVLAKQRIEINLIAATNGQAIKLDKNQEELIYKVANQRNIHKNVVIQGPEGSGKTLLGMEIVKLMVNNYISTENLSPEEIEKDIRVIFSACYNQREQVKLWIAQMESIVKLNSNITAIRCEPIRARMERHPKAYNDDSNLILDLIQRDRSYGNFKKTIIMIDELSPGFESSDWELYQHFKGKGVYDVQIVFCLKHDFHDLKIRNNLNEHDDRDYDEPGMLLLKNVLVGRLHKGHRCSNEIRNFIYYLLMHEFNDGNLHEFKSFHHDEPSFDAEEKPVWIDTVDAKSFFDLVDTQVTLFQNIPGKTVALIYDPKTIDPQVKSECDTRSWKHVSKEKVVGTEFSTVIIYDLEEFHFDAFSRAINRLIIVTTSSTRYVSVFQFCLILSSMYCFYLLKWNIEEGIEGHKGQRAQRCAM